MGDMNRELQKAAGLEPQEMNSQLLGWEVNLQSGELTHDNARLILQIASMDHHHKAPVTSSFEYWCGGAGMVQYFAIMKQGALNVEEASADIAYT